MPDPRDLKTVERDLAGAVMAFNVSRVNLSNTIKGLSPKNTASTMRSRRSENPPMSWISNGARRAPNSPA